MKDDKITLTFHLGGNAICGDERKPKSCRTCPKLSDCVLDLFYDTLNEVKK